MATDHGKITALGFDRKGVADESLTFVPGDELLKACAGIKSAERGIVIDGDSATVTTYYKSASSKAKEFQVHRSIQPFPNVEGAIAACIERWGATPRVSEAAGRYDVAYLLKAIRAAGLLCDSLVLSAFDGGPLRLQGESIELIVLLLPQTAEPIPPLPDWILEFGAESA